RSRGWGNRTHPCKRSLRRCINPLRHQGAGRSQALIRFTLAVSNSPRIESKMAKRRQNFQNTAWFHDIYKRELLDMQPPYQRRSVWNDQFKQSFIETILLDYPAPAIFLFSRIDASGLTKYELVDGKQRLTSV